jgi:hypothetical protein
LQVPHHSAWIFTTYGPNSQDRGSSLEKAVDASTMTEIKADPKAVRAAKPKAFLPFVLHLYASTAHRARSNAIDLKILPPDTLASRA